MPAGVCRRAFTRRFSITRSTLAASTSTSTGDASTRIGCDSIPGSSRATRRASSLTSVGARSGWMCPRSSRSRSSRSSTRRFIFLPPCSIMSSIVERSSSVSPICSARCRVWTDPRIPASGPFRSCETACRSVSFTSFSSRRPLVTAASRSRWSHWAAMIRRRVPSRTATERNAANRKIAFHHGSRSYCG